MDRAKQRHSHFLLECPRCRNVVESCGCTDHALPRYPARLPCRACCAIIATFESYKYRTQKQRRRHE